MLNKAKALRGYKIHALDGEIGKVDEFFSTTNSGRLDI